MRVVCAFTASRPVTCSSCEDGCNHGEETVSLLISGDATWDHGGVYVESESVVESGQPKVISTWGDLTRQEQERARDALAEELERVSVSIWQSGSPAEARKPGEAA